MSVALILLPTFNQQPYTKRMKTSKSMPINKLNKCMNPLHHLLSQQLEAWLLRLLYFKRDRPFVFKVRHTSQCYYKLSQILIIFFYFKFSYSLHHQIIITKIQFNS